MGTNMLRLLKKYFVCIAFFAFGFCVLPAYSQETEESEDSTLAPTKTSEDNAYYFEQNKSGQPTFTQVLKWSDSPGVYYYEITLQTTSGRVILRNERTTTNQLEVHLEPGNYQYKVYAYNLLGVFEQESDWIPLEIKQAYLPAIRSISPSRMYIEDEDFRFEINGSGFAPDLEVYFESLSGIVRRVVEPVSITSTKISFDFPRPEIFLGPTFNVVVRDKSGLQDIYSDFVVKFRKPVDFYIGATYTPWFPLTDDWYKNTILKKSFLPISASNQIGLVFYKSAFGYLGAELRTTYRLADISNEAGDITIDYHSILMSANFLYEWWFVRKCSLFLKLGAGATVSLFVTDDDRSAYSVDPMYNVGLGFRVKPVKYFYIDIGVNLDQTINRGKETEGAGTRYLAPLVISPEIGFGFRY